MRSLVLIIFALLIPTPSVALTQPADCGYAEVAASLASAVDGDVVVIPAGECNWTQRLSIPSSLSVSIIGAGLDSTYISIDSGSTFRVQPNPGEFVRISGMELDCGIEVSAGSGGSGVKVQNGFRIDHIKIDQSARGSTTCSKNVLGELSSWTYGVFDHIYMDMPSHTGVIGGSPMENSPGVGMEVWYEDAGWGTADFVYLEDSVINNNGAPQSQNGSFDGRWGLKLVLRHNQFKNHDWGWHDNHATNSTAGRAQELYENDVQITSSGQRKWNQGHRGGNFYVWNNRVAIHDVSNQIIMITYNRSTGPHGEWGTCDNVAEKFCVHPNDPIGEPHPGGTAPTQDSDCDTGGLAVQVDSQVDADGWLCRNQTGSGMTNRTTGVQDLEPSYAWGNLFCEDGAGAACTPDTPFTIDIIVAEIEANRDVYNENGSPSGYTPLPYPHPLTVAAPPKKVTDLQGISPAQ